MLSGLLLTNKKLRHILDSNLTRNRRQSSEYFLGMWIFTGRLPITFLTKGASVVNHAGFEHTSMHYEIIHLSQCTTTPFVTKEGVEISAAEVK